MVEQVEERYDVCRLVERRDLCFHHPGLSFLEKTSMQESQLSTFTYVYAR